MISITHREGAKMPRSFKPFVCFLCALFAIIATSRLASAESILKEGDRLAIIGDSITEQKQYSVFVEAYLRMCQPTPLEVMQFGWGGETSWGFLKRIDGDVLPFKPTLVTTCYGMNDGGYRATDPTSANNYRKAMTEIVERFNKAGARVIVGSPGAVDPVTYKRQPPAEVYNQTLADYGQIAKEVAQASGSIFADVHTPMRDVTDKAKARYGPAYHVAGNDGFHPSANGHLVMAYAFLKAMELDGQIASINVDLAAASVTASAHHAVKGMENGSVTIESGLYPFCFGGDPATPNATAGIVEFFPFNQDLNRFTLTVTNTTAPRYKITWGKTTREYTAEELNKGVNLAADFIDNPFSEPFQIVERAIREKQTWETKMIRNLLPALRSARTQIGEDPAIDAVEALSRREQEKLTNRVAEVFKPVTHTITIEAVQ